MNKKKYIITYKGKWEKRWGKFRTKGGAREIKKMVTRGNFEKKYYGVKRI